MKLTFRINKSSDFIFEYLTDMQKFVSVHPVITKINKLADDRYLVYETLKLGFMPFSFTYPVTIVSQPATNTVIMYVTVMKFTKIEIKFVLRSEGDNTLVEEYIQFKSPLTVKWILSIIFKKQHQQLFNNLEIIKKS